MRIATFNVESLDLPVEERARVLRPALERLEADVVCLQEVNGQHVPGEGGRRLAALDELVRGTDYAGFHRAWTKGSSGAGLADVHNLVTLSRFAILDQAQLLHHLVPPAQVSPVTADPPSAAPDAQRFDRPALVTELDLGDRRLHLVNVHLRAPLAAPIAGRKIGPFSWSSVAAWAEGYYLSGLKRTGQALELRLHVDAIFDREPDALVLVAGDFNAEDHETPMRMLQGAPEDTGNAALAARSLVLLDRGLETTRRFSVVHHGRPQMLDHMLASHALFGRFRDIEVHNEALGDEAVGYGKGVEAMGSYHAALVATFAD